MSTSSTGAGYPAEGEIVEGKYIVERVLSQGGMGVVVQAVHILRRAPVALKFLNPKMLSIEGSHERFIREAVAASIIASEHVVKIHDVGTFPPATPYLVMEFLQGVDLATLVDREGAPGLAIERSVHFVLQLLRALQVAHANNVVHRDLKPSNCYVIAHDGEPDFLKVLDFGVSKVRLASEAVITRANTALGTPIYMAPEQAKSPRDADARSDLYSTAVILYEILAGALPLHTHGRTALQLLREVVTEEPIPITRARADLPPGLAAAVHKGMHKDPNQRFQSALEMAMAFTEWSDSRSDRVLEKLRTFDGSGVSTSPVDIHSLLERTRRRPSSASVPAAAPPTRGADTRFIVKDSPNAPEADPEGDTAQFTGSFAREALARAAFGGSSGSLPAAAPVTNVPGSAPSPSSGTPSRPPSERPPVPSRPVLVTPLPPSAPSGDVLRRTSSRPPSTLASGGSGDGSLTRNRASGAPQTTGGASARSKIIVAVVLAILAVLVFFVARGSASG